MKKVIVFGATGMAGHIITMYLESLRDKYIVNNVCYRNKFNDKSIICDVSNIGDIDKIIDDIQPDIVINCIGVLNKASEDNIYLTTYVNTFFPRYLETIGKKKNFKLIHISTDCVFSGKQGRYTETSIKDEKGIYGLSKNLGEIINNKDLTFRTSIIGPELKNGSGLFHWFMSQNGEVEGYKSAIWTGVTTLELAKAIDKAIDLDLSGLYHLVNNDIINKFDLISLFNKYFKENKIAINENYVYKCDKSLLNTRCDFNFKVAKYEQMIREMKQWVMENSEVYKLYNIT